MWQINNCRFLVSGAFTVMDSVGRGVEIRRENIFVPCERLSQCELQDPNKLC